MKNHIRSGAILRLRVATVFGQTASIRLGRAWAPPAPPLSHLFNARAVTGFPAFRGVRGQYARTGWF
jgi:hypothetical protein